MAAKLTCCDEDFTYLGQISISCTEHARKVEGAQITLGYLMGDRNGAIGACMGLKANTLATGRNRFLECGVSVLRG
jgi:hypothetical protein